MGNAFFTSSIPLVVVAAVGRNGGIGHGDRLPWSIPSDLARFKAITMGKPLVMGRRTFEAIGRVLPGRETIVVTGAAFAPVSGLFSAENPDQALALARDRAAAMGADEVILAGGATLFTAMMPLTSRLRMTFVDLAPIADTFFPPIDPAIWREDSRIHAERGRDDDAACEFVDFERRA